MSTYKLKLNPKNQIPQDLELGVQMTRKTKPVSEAVGECCFPCFEHFDFSGDLFAFVSEEPINAEVGCGWPVGDEDTWTGMISVVGDLCDYTGEFQYQWLPPEVFVGDPPVFTPGTDDAGAPTLTITGTSDHDGGNIIVWLEVTHPTQDCDFVMGPRILMNAGVPCVLGEMTLNQSGGNTFPAFPGDIGSASPIELRIEGTGIDVCGPTEVLWEAVSWGGAPEDSVEWQINPSSTDPGALIFNVFIGAYPDRLTVDYTGIFITFQASYVDPELGTVVIGTVTYTGV